VGALWVVWWGLIGTLEVPPLRPSWLGFIYNSPTLVATYLVLAGPFALVSVAKATRRRSIVWGLAGLLVLALFLSGSRGAYLAAALGLGAALATISARIGLAAVAAGLAASIRRHQLRFAIPLLGLVPLALLGPALLHRLQQGGVEIRLDLWRSALAIFIEHPLAGAGPGTWPQLKVLSNPPDVPNVIFPHAHQLYLQLAAETGLIGLLSVGLVGFVVLRRLLEGSASPVRDVRWDALAAIAGITAYGVLGIIDVSGKSPIALLLVVGIAAWNDAGLRVVPGADGKVRARYIERWITGPALACLGLLFLVASLPLYVRADIAEAASEAGAEAARIGLWQDALDHYRTAAELDPGFTLYELEVAGAQARLGDISAARSRLTDVIQFDAVAVNIIGLASLDLAAGDDRAAIEHARRAVDLGTGEPTIALNAGLIGEAVGDLEFATEQFAHAIEWDPALAASDIWSAPTRLVAKAPIVAMAVQDSSPLNASLILSYAGRSDEARDLLRRQPPSGLRDIYLAVATWRGGDTAAARIELARLLDVNPLDWNAAAWLSRIARLSGDPAAGRYELWARIVQGDAAPAVLMEVSAIPPTTDAAVAGLPQSYPYGVYGRATSPFLLMPGLTLIGER
jgi:O-antigen ligase